MKKNISGQIRYATTFCFLLILTAVLFTACKKDTGIQTKEEDEPASAANKAMSTEEGFQATHSWLSWRTLIELWEARGATARYQNINNAIADGYADIDVIVEHMGHHYMKSSLLDATFNNRKPEILVYNRKSNGHFELVAVEYAVPIELSPNHAPAGFTGSADVWDRNEGFGLWLLHAWVWHFNPDGVFNPTNPLVHTH
jgi:hypothetical protein